MSELRLLRGEESLFFLGGMKGNFFHEYLG